MVPPLPGTYSPGNPAGAVYPFYSQIGTGVLDLFESTGTFRQNQLIANVNARVSAKFTLFGFYAFSHANSDVLGGGGGGGGRGGGEAGVGGQPSNPYNFADDYGRASFDIRHHGMINGSLSAPFGVRLSPNITMNSAPPFNIVSGVDQYGSAQFNSRPAFVPAGFTAPACTSALANAGTACIVNTAAFGSLVINPKPGMTIIPVNYGNGFAQFNVNMRISRSWGFGEKATSGAAPAGGRGGRGGGGFGPGIPGGGRPGGFGGGDTSGNKYTLTLGLYARNILNTVNPGTPEGNLLSPRFDQSTSLASAGFGATQSANRRMDFSLRFGF